MDSKTLKEHISRLSGRQQKLSAQLSYAKGLNPVIFQEYAKPDPDNRIPIPFATKAVSLYSGYMARPGTVTYSGEFYDTVLKPIFNGNDEELVSAQEFEQALIHGECFELHWAEDNGTELNFYPVPVSQGIPIYSNDLKPELEMFIWYRTRADKKELANVYDDMTIQFWARVVGGEWIMTAETPHAYGEVPVNVGRISSDCSNLFDHMLPLIDLYDKLISGEVANEAQRYSAALLMFAEKFDDVTEDETGRTMVDRIRELRLLDGMGDDPGKKAAYLTRDIPVAFIEFCMVTVERLIYETLPMFNPNDDSFAAASGVAQEYKLLAFEYKCAQIETYWSRFLQNRIYMINGVINGLGTKTEGYEDVNIKFTRNLPRNLAELADTTAKLKGTLSDQTILTLFPSYIVPSVKQEMLRLKGEMPTDSFDIVESEVEKDGEEEMEADSSPVKYSSDSSKTDQFSGEIYRPGDI